MKFPLSKRITSLCPSSTLALSAKAKQMRAAGLDVVGFGAGEPDFDTPQHIKAAAAKALEKGFTKYTPSSGIWELREAIAEKFKRENGIEYDPSQVIVTSGGKHACFNAILAICNPGDEVILPAPYWVSYPEMVKLAEALPVILQTKDETDFKILPDQLEAAITKRTKLFILNSPNNPSGTVYSPSEIKALGDVCVRRGIYILSDEIYEHLLYENAIHQSVASLSSAHCDHTILVHGFAKAWSMTGWRLGFLAAPKAIASAVDALQSHSTSNANSFAQKGAIAAIKGSQNHLTDWLAQFDKRRIAAHEMLCEMRGVQCVKPKGAFYLFPNIAETGFSSDRFCQELLQKKHVAIVAGSAFGSEDHLRISYATSLQNIEKGLERMGEFVKQIHK